MALSDNEKRKYMPTPKRRASGEEAYRRRFSDSQKIEAVTTFLMVGSLTMVSNMLRVNINTLKQWRKSEWWKEIEQQLRVQEDLQLSKRLQNIVTKSLDVIEDRLESGDFVYDQKTGEMRRKPVNMKDAHRVALDMNERREILIDRHVQNESISTDKIEKTLQDLATKFAEMTKQITAKPAIEVTDILFGDAPDAKKES